MSSATLNPLVELPARLLLPAFFLGDFADEPAVDDIALSVTRPSFTRYYSPTLSLSLFSAEPCALPHSAPLTMPLCADWEVGRSRLQKLLEWCSKFLT